MNLRLSSQPMPTKADEQGERLDHILQSDFLPVKEKNTGSLFF
jgi:hypothetical protein